MKSIQKTFKEDSVELDILDYTPGLDRKVKRRSRFDIPRDIQLASRCMEHVMNYLMEYGEDPGVLMVGWKTYIQLELEADIDKRKDIPSIYRNGLMYFQDAVVVVDTRRDFYIKAMPYAHSAADYRPESEKIIEEFKELVIRAIDSGVGVDELRKTIGLALVHKVLAS